jgi:NADPH2:quinone reductase
MSSAREGNRNKTNQRPDLIVEGMSFVAKGVSAGSIKPAVAAFLPLSQTAEGHRMLEERRAQGIVVLDPRS